jgi:hypothetical protein
MSTRELNGRIKKHPGKTAGMLKNFKRIFILKLPVLIVPGHTVILSVLLLSLATV